MNLDVNLFTENVILRKYFAWLESKPKAFSLVIGLMCLGVNVFVDWYYGTAYDFTFIYIFPVALTTWFAGKRGGLFIAALAAISYSINKELFLDMAAVWNATGTFIVFSAIGILVRSVRVMWEKEQSLSSHDCLTGLLNSRAFIELLGYEIHRCIRSPAPFTLAYIDLDSFKEVNDKYGHQGGDQLLKSIADIMRSTFRSTDLISRMGGDEFAIFFPNTDMEHVRVIEEKFRHKFSASMKKNNFPTSFSMGIVTFNLPPTNADDAINQADKAMYLAKYSGKNRTEFVEA